MKSLKTLSGIQVLEHDLANKYDLPKHVIEHLDIYWGRGSFEECCKNKKNFSTAVLEWLFKKESITGWKLNKCMKAAAKNDNADLVNCCIQKGADDFNGAMAWAAGRGHIKIVRLMIDHGANENAYEIVVNINDNKD